LQAALDRFGLGQLLEAEAAPGGLFGQVVLLSTTTGSYALRGHPHPGQIARERNAVELIHQRTRVPVPWPYQTDASTAIFGWEYALMPRMPGVQLADGEARKALSDGDRTAIAGAMARCLADLHEAAFDQPGTFDLNSAEFGPATPDYASWFGAWTRWWLEQSCQASTATTDDDVAWVEGIISDAASALAEPFTPALVDTDFKEGNAVAQRDADTDAWRISGVFDLAETFIGDGEVDLARACFEYVRRPQVAEAFLGTYLGLRPPRRGFERRLRHYLLHDRMIIWEYAQRNSVWVQPGQPLRSWAEPQLDAVIAVARSL
jgi:aminoglycoside phosphotransferase (APT) family kinase protein